VSNTAETADKLLFFFQKLSDERKVTIVRTDVSENKVVKSVIANEATFPFQSFFQDSHSFSLFNQSNTIYSSDKTSRTTKMIPSFNSSSVIQLQSLQEYFKSNDKSANGIYNIIPLKLAEKENLLDELADFFGTSVEDLQTPKMQSKKEYINRDFLIYFGIFCILALLTLLSVISIPISQIKSIGVWKLCGFKTKDVFKKLFLLPYLVTISVAFIFDIFVSLYFSYIPHNFLLFLAAAQSMILILLSAAVLLAYSLIRVITIVSLVKNSQKFTLGIGAMSFLKTVMIVFTTVLLMGCLASIREISKANEIYQKAAKEGSFLTVEHGGYSTDEAFKNFELNNGKNEERTAVFFSNLEKNSNAFFFTGVIENPIRNLSRYNSSETFTADDNYEIVSVNKNYLNSISLSISNINGKNIFLVPNTYQNEKAKLTKLCQMHAYANLSEQEQERNTLEDTPVTLHFYKNKKSTAANVFWNNDLVTFKTPIYEVISTDHLDYFSKSRLLSTGVNSPIRVANTQKNRDYISEQLKSEAMTGITLKFSTISSILNTNTDSSKLALTFMSSLLLIIFSLSLIVSAFVCLLYFMTNKMLLSVKRLLGLKLLDRYKGIIFAWSITYFVQILVATIYVQSILGLAIGAVLIILDLFICVSILSYQENKNLVSVLKGE
ncbi:MAG: DUF1430 domain-containing protein, partial [Streptococcaceae bacterium]|nr:DUF1430 domain-containing protein [Streptococcaceae bacterium]